MESAFTIEYETKIEKFQNVTNLLNKKNKKSNNIF